MGSVWEVFPEESGPNPPARALKIVRSLHRGQLEAMQAEIRLLSRLDHPGIVRILDHGVADESPWILMPRIDGVPLHEWVGRVAPGRETDIPTRDLGPRDDGALDRLVVADEALSSPATLTDTVADPRASSGHPVVRPVLEHAGELQRLGELMVQLCLALHHVHSLGLVHRDLKPANIIVTSEDRPVLVDFGLGEGSARTGRETLEDMRHSHGTPGYVAPEVLRGEQPDSRADLFALGAMLFEALSGHLPHEGTRGGRLLQIDADVDIPDVLAFAPNLDPELAALVNELVHPDPRHRPGYAVDVAARLVDLELARPVSLPTDTWLFRPRVQGQESIVAAMNRSMDTAAQGTPGGIILRAPSGSGKTRLALDLMRRAASRGFRIFAVAAGSMNHIGGRGDPDPPWQLILALSDRLRRAFALLNAEERAEALPDGAHGLGMLDAKWRQMVPVTPRETPEPIEDVPAWIAREIHAVLSAISIKHPVLVVLDDLHWVDERSARTLFELYRLLEEKHASAMVLSTTRDGRSPGYVRRLVELRGLRLLSPSPLNGDQVRLMIVDLLGQNGVSEPIADPVIRTSGGNPFLVTTAVRALIERGILKRFPGEGWEVLGTTEDLDDLENEEDDLVELALANLERVPEDIRPVLDAAALAGQLVSTELLARALRKPLPAIEFACDTLTMHRWFTHLGYDGQLTFAHARIREGVAALVPPLAARRLNVALAEALAPHSDTPHVDDARRAAFLEAAGELERASVAWASAGRFAARNSAWKAANLALHRAASLTEDPALRTTLELESIDKGACRGGQLDECMERLARIEEAVLGLGDNEALARLRILQLTVNERRGEIEGLLERFEALRVLFDGIMDPGLRHAAMHLEGVLHLRQQDAERASALLLDAATFAREHNLREEEGRSRAEWALAQRFRINLLAEFPQLYEIGQQLEGQGWLGSAADAYAYAIPALVAGGFIRLAEKALGRARHLHATARTHDVQLRLAIVECQVAHARGDFTRALAVIEPYIAAQRRLGNGLRVHFALGSQAMVERSRGRYEVARRIAQDALPFFVERQMGHGIAHLGPVLATSLVAAAELDEALAQATAAEEAAAHEDHPMPRTEARMIRARIHRLQGDLDEARNLLRSHPPLDVGPELAVQAAAEWVHLAIAHDDDPSSHVAHLQALVLKAEELWFYESPRIVERALAAVEHHRTGRHHLLFRGEPLDVLPGRLRQKLERMRAA